METVPSFPPFIQAHQLCDDLDLFNPDTPDAVALPGYPSIALNDSARTTQFLDKELCSPDLEAIAPRLWIMATESGANVNPLHRQRVKGRQIVITEEPRLHLVWIHDRIFIKPLPRYLLSYAFWEVFLATNSMRLGDRRETIRKAAMGYMRTYRYLIQHESDFLIAKQDHLRLVPQNVQWADFCHFISRFNDIRDSNVSKRYCYGELRLSRLNIYAPFLLHKFQFEQVHGQYGDYFARLYGPVIFIFAVVSTVLNCMQVGLAVEQVSSRHWVALWSVSRWFSAVSLVGTALISLCFFLLWAWMFLDEWIFAIKTRMKKTREGHEHSKC
jgi:hypothetical protein